MTDSHPADVIEASAYTVPELRKIVFAGNGSISRPLALSLLARKDYPEKIDDLEQLLMNEKEEPRLRHTAAVQLGRLGTPAAVEALQRGSKARDGLTLRGVAEGLGLAGQGESLSAIEPLKRRSGPTGEIARRAAALLRYRLGAGGSEMPAGNRLRVDPRGSAAIEIRAAEGELIVEALSQTSHAVPALRLTSEGAVAFDCQGRSLMFLFAEASRGGLAQLTKQKAQVGVVVLRQERETPHWEVGYHVLTETTEEGRVGIRVTDSKGALRLAGTARVDGERAAFELWSVSGAGAVAVEIAGVYEGATLTFSQARSDVQRRPAPAPTRLRG